MRFDKDRQFDGCKDISTKEKLAMGSTAVAGVGACAAGTTAAIVGTTTLTTVTTAGASAAAVTATGATIGTTVGAVTGGVVGTGIGIATGGTAIAGTVPLAIAGGTTGGAVGASVATTVAGWLGIPMATTTTVAVVTTPVWAIPVAIAGGACALGALGVFCYRKMKRRNARSQVLLLGAGE